MALEILTSLSILLLVGLILTYLCQRIKISNVLVLIVAGLLISYFKINGEKIVNFSTDFLTSIAIIALIMIVFDSTSRFHFRMIARETGKALELSLLFMFCCLIVVSVATKLILGLEWWVSFLFSSMMLGTDPSGVLMVLSGMKHRAISFLEWESIINTPLTVIVPFMVIEFSKSFSWGNFFSQFLEQVVPFLQQIVTGVGAGIVVFLVMFKILRGKYVDVLTPVALLVSALLTYVLAESLKGNGVLAVTALGLMFGNVYIKKKETLQTFGHLFSTLFEILVFLLLGVSIILPTSIMFYMKVAILFVIYLLVRAGAVFFIFRKQKERDVKEKLFISLNTSKGVAAATVLFILISTGVGSSELFDLGILFIIYSLVLSTFIAKLSKKFIKVELPSK
ncbi:MAG: cation:proton antiporter [Candidatus Woesearchaeota archaeon]